jgi:ubiquinone/menaquinone biosynthesis C-methylase UbiE
MATDSGKIARWYDAKAEWQWAWSDRNPVEFAVTLRALAEHLPPPPARILDVGGGPGRYAIALAQQGYRVTLFELSAASLDLARQKAAEHGVQLESYVHGTATDLGAFTGERFDVVLAMGPFYHLLTLAEREQALAEARRVLIPGGLLFATFLCRFTPLRFAAHNVPTGVYPGPGTDEFLATGVMVLSGDPEVEGGWVDAYCERPEAIRPFLERGGFEALDLVGTEGLYSFLQDKAGGVPPDRWDAFVDLNYRLGKEPSLLGATEHLLGIGRKRP